MARWSVDVGRFHIITLSTVHQFEPGSEQYQWMINDLQQATAPVNRSARPWIVLTTHYPLYCTLGDCFCNYTAGIVHKACGVHDTPQTRVLMWLCE
jgi:hypothetical protein